MASKNSMLKKVLLCSVTVLFIVWLLFFYNTCCLNGKNEIYVRNQPSHHAKKCFAPIIIYNTTPSVPIGLYKNIVSFKQLLSYSRGSTSTIYVVLYPNVLLQDFPNMNSYAVAKLHTHAVRLLRKKMFIMKQLSRSDRNYIKVQGMLPEKIFAYSDHKDGISSADIGLIDRRDIIGFYVLFY